MTAFHPAMDDIDRKIIDLLAEDARRSLTDIGEYVGLSASAINERIRRLVASGAVRRFTIDAAPDAMGRPVLAFVCLALAADTDEAAFRAFAATHAAIEECHHVTGAWSYIAKVRVASLPELEAFLAELKARKFIARSETIIALSSAVEASYTPKPVSP